MEDNKRRCSWLKDAPQFYLDYHDFCWAKPVHDDHELFEMLILEGFQAGLSWLTILKKRDNFRKAFDNFDPCKIIHYDQKKIDSLMNNSGIIRNKNKILACISNARVFIDIQIEYETFANYIWHFTNNQTIYIVDYALTNNELSDKISDDLKKRGMKYVGTTIIYAYLQAIGILNGHQPDCFLYRK